VDNKIDFFDNEMDEKTVESISDNFPILTDDEKDRIFSRIEKEVGNKDGGINYEVYNDEVNGVERCIRPRWMEIFGTAAMIAVVLGGLGLGKYCMNNMNKTAPKDNEQEVTTEVQPTVPDVENTTDSTKPKVTTTKKNDPDKPVSTSYVKVVVPVYESNTDIVHDNEFVDPLVMDDVVNEYNGNTFEDNSKVSSETANIVTSVTTTFIEADVDTTATNVISTAVPVDVAETTEVTANVVKNENDISAIAESLIEKYDLICEIKTGQLPRDETGDVVTIMHDSSSSTRAAYTMRYRKISDDIFKNMQELKDFYYSVMYPETTDHILFGPELSMQDIKDGLCFGSYDYDYFYISIDGELYGNTISVMELNSPTAEPLVISDVTDDSFIVYKEYVKANNTDKSFITTFYIVKNYESGKWVIYSVGYNG
jgi:hypothetical protein